MKIQAEFWIVILSLQRATATLTWARSGSGEMNSAAGSSPSPTSTWTPCRTRTTARRQTPSAWTARTAWRPASPPALQTTSPGRPCSKSLPPFKAGESVQNQARGLFFWEKADVNKWRGQWGKTGMLRTRDSCVSQTAVERTRNRVCLDSYSF